MTTTFHFETNEPQYEYSYEGAECSSAARALSQRRRGRHPHSTRTPTVRGSSSLRSAGSEYWQGVGRSLPSATAASAYETREAMWANAMAGLVPPELVETIAPVADSVYALADPTNGRVQLGRAGLGAKRVDLRW